MARQSVNDRLERLDKGCCPIHAIDMPQIGQMGEDASMRWLVACPRRDCEIQGTSLRHEGPIELLPAFQLLIGHHRV